MAAGVWPLAKCREPHRSAEFIERGRLKRPLSFWCLNGRKMQMDVDAFFEYRTAEREGRKADAKRHVESFLNSINSDAERREWIAHHLPDMIVNGAGRIRHELFVEVVWPVLSVDVRNGDVHAMITLARLGQNMISAKVPEFQPGYGNETALWRMAFERCPESETARTGYGKALLVNVDYAFHEWPSGVLLANQADWQAELEELSVELDLIELLLGNKISLKISKYRRWIIEYRERMSVN